MTIFYAFGIAEKVAKSKVLLEENGYTYKLKNPIKRAIRVVC